MAVPFEIFFSFPLAFFNTLLGLCLQARQKRESMRTNPNKNYYIVRNIECAIIGKSFYYWMEKGNEVMLY